MNVAFIGAVQGSATALEALIRAGKAPGLVVTLPPSSAARHSDYADLRPLAEEAGASLLLAANINSPEVIGALRDFGTDIALVVGWSQICHEAFRSAPRIGCIGFHPAPLPRLRGRAVIPWTILLGATSTAATLFWLDDGVDSGPILLQEHIAVAPDETALSLYAKQTGALARMLPRAVDLAASATPPRIEQDHSEATYCAKRTPDDGLIDWRDSSEAILRLIRAAGEPYPGAFTTLGTSRLIVDAAAPFAESHRFHGLAGQIQCHTPDGFAVRCGDGACIQITQWRDTQSRGRPPVHAKLGGWLPS